MFAKKPQKTFSCTSFKDIHLLINDENTPKSSIFHRVKLVNSLIKSWSTQPKITLPNTDTKIVIYFTSLRIVRSTFENCRTVRSILKSFPIQIDERDVSMDHNFIAELHRIFPQKNPKNNNISLPKVFIGGKYIGGAEEIRNLHENGELNKLLSTLPKVRDLGDCDNCNGIRFILCDECNGSRKCYFEKGGFKMCNECNENGLVRCSYCS